MNRLVLIFVLLLLPLQASWAAVTAYCTHENGVASQHFGHHYHKHHASTGDSSGDSRGGGGLDRDCGYCHLNIKLVHSAALPPLLDLGPQQQVFVPRHRWSSFVPRVPERPNWPLLV